VVIGAMTPKLGERLQQIPGTEISVQRSTVTETAKILHRTLWEAFGR